MSRNFFLGILMVVIFLSGVTIWIVFNGEERIESVSAETSESESGNLIDEDESPVPVSIPVASGDLAAQPNDSSALGGYDVLIADRGNNRLLEVTPDKKIVWHYLFNLPKKGLGADDSFFTDSGRTVIVNLEEYETLELIDYATKHVTWSYGKPGKSGSGAGFLHTPDDAYKLPNGDVIVADISNCRVIEIAPDKHIVHQYGQTRKCKNVPGYLDKPNGDTPLPNGHILISNIWSDMLIELNEKWQPVFSMKLPVRYPSDPQLTKDGNILISDYSNPGKIVEVSRQGKIIWEYGTEKGQYLNRPSLAIELPNGNILSNDDMNHRVIVIDKKTKKIVWQYGATGKPGSGSGQLNTPDGLDIIMRTTSFIQNALVTEQQSMQAEQSGSALPLHTIGQVTRHANGFIGQSVRLQGYPIKTESGYAIFSDEAGGTVGRYDLPVTGSGITAVQLGHAYILEGIFLNHGLISTNRNPDHLGLSQAPEEIK